MNYPSIDTICRQIFDISAARGQINFRHGSPHGFVRSLTFWRKEIEMTLTYAADRLYQEGWLPEDGMDLDRLPDGRRFPSVLAVQREFATAGLELAIKHNLIFKCYRAMWSDESREQAVVGNCEREAAVYALAQLRKNLKAADTASKFQAV